MKKPRKKRQPFTKRDVSVVRKLAEAGMSLSEAAAHMKRSAPVVRIHAIKHGITFRFAGTQKKIGRDDVPAIISGYRGGEILDVIAADYDVTRERIRQILKKHGVSGNDGGKSVVAAENRAAQQVERDRRFIEKRGCTYAQWKMLNVIGRKQMACGAAYSSTPIGAFVTQKNNARKRGIAWDFTLWQWWSIWQASGKWSQRGRGQGYVMCRRGDTGPYAEWNVFIGRATENNSKTKRKLSGLPIGVSPSRSGKYIAHRIIDGKPMYLGTHPTPELAHAAYLQAEARAQ